MVCYTAQCGMMLMSCMCVLHKGVVNRGARGAKAFPVFQVLVPIFEKFW